MIFNGWFTGRLCLLCGCRCYLCKYSDSTILRRTLFFIIFLALLRYCLWDPGIKYSLASYSHQDCESWRDQQIKETKVIIPKSVSCNKKQDSFFLSSAPCVFFFLGAELIVLYALRDLPAQCSNVKAIGFLSFSFPELFSELETKHRSQLG